MSYSPYSLLAKQDLRHVLRPADQNCWDWMHCLLSNGVVNIAAFKWLEVLGEWELLHGYVQKFVLPKAFNTIQLKTILDSKRLPKHRAHGKINATASELLTLCSVLAHFARTVCVPANVHIQETNLFLALVLFLDLLQASWHGKVRPADLKHAAEDCLVQWNQLSWNMIKKHHWMLHFHEMLEKHGCIPPCFCMERKNKVPARIASGIQNTRAFEQSLYLEVVTLELERVKSPHAFALDAAMEGVKPAGKPLKKVAAHLWHNVDNLQTCKTARILYGTCSKGDVVYMESAVGNKFDACEIMTFVSNTGTEVAIGHMLALKHLHKTFAVWIETDQLEAIDLKQLKAAVSFSKNEGEVTTLTPWHLR